MNLTELLTEVRVELQDSGSAIWTDAELTRGVRKSIGLLSRLMPKRAVVETTVVIDVSAESITTPTTASATAIVNVQTLNAVVDGGTLTIADKTPDVPRRLTVTLADPDFSVTSLVILIKGYDKDGYYVEERWFLQDLVGGTAIQGTRYFKYVSEVEVEDIEGTAAAGDTVSVGTGNAYDTYVFLANKPLDYDQETVTSSPAGTSFTRDTDYVMDYINGGIKFINGGGMAAGTAYLVTYKLDTLMLDLNALLPNEDYLKVERVEYPIGAETPTFITFEPMGDILLVKGSGVSLSEDEHLRIIYLKPWSMPGAHSEGDYPRHLDNALVIGSCGQALIFKAEKYVQQSLTEIALTNAAADSMATPLRNINLALGNVTQNVDDADTAYDAAIAELVLAANALGKINSDGGMTYLTDADSALDNVATALGKVNTYLVSNTNEDSKFWLTKITTDIASLRTAITAAQDAANAELDTGSFSSIATYISEASDALAKVSTYLESHGGEDSKTWLVKITTDIADLRAAMKTAIDLAGTYLTHATVDPSAKFYLTQGDGTITSVNDAARVAENYADYARASMQLYAGLVSEATTRLDNLRSYIEQSGAWGRVANGFVAEAAQRVAMASQIVNREATLVNQALGYVNEAASRLDNLRSYIQQAGGWGQIAQGFVNEAVQRVAESQGRLAIADRRLAEAAGSVNNANTYIAEGNGRLAMSQTFIAEGNVRVAEVNAWAVQADRYAVTSRQYLDISGRFLASGQSKINEFLIMLGVKSELSLYKGSSEQFS